MQYRQLAASDIVPLLSGIPPYSYTFKSGVKTSSASSVVTLTPPAGTLLAVVTAAGGPLYVTYDGSDPSSSNYHEKIAADGSLPLNGIALSNVIRLIGTSYCVAYFG